MGRLDRKFTLKHPNMNQRPSLHLLFRAFTIAALIPICGCKFGKMSFNPATPSQSNPVSLDMLKVSSPTESLTAGECGLLLIESKSENSEPRSQGADSLLTLSSGANGKFYSDPMCMEEVVRASIVQGTTTAQVYFRDTVAENVVLSISGEGVVSGRIVLQVTPDSPNKLVYSQGPVALTAGSCRSFILQSQDVFGNPSSVLQDSDISVSSTGLGSFFSSSGCPEDRIVANINLPAGEAQIELFFRDFSPESINLTAQAIGFSAAAFPVAISATSPSALVFVSPLSSVIAGVCNPLAVSVHDVYGNPSPVRDDTSIGLSLIGNGTLYDDRICTHPVPSVTVTAGRAESELYFKSELSQSQAIVNVNAPSLAPASDTISVSSALAQKLRISGASEVTSEGCSAAYVVEALDEFNNPARLAQNQDIDLHKQGSLLFFQDGICNPGTDIVSVRIPAGESSQKFYVKDSIPENISIYVSAGLVLAESSLFPLAVNSATGILAFTTLLPSVSSGACAIYSLQTKNSLGVPTNVPNPVEITLTGKGQGTFFSDTSCGHAEDRVTVPAGNGSVSFSFRSTKAESGLFFNASATNYTSATQTVSVLAGNASQLAIQNDIATLAVGVCNPVTIFSADQDGNRALPAVPITVTLANTGNGIFHSGTPCGTGNIITEAPLVSGQATIYFRSTVVGSNPITLTPKTGVLNPVSRTVAMIVGPPTKITLSGTSAPYTATCQSYTLFLKDSLNNTTVAPSLGLSITLTTSATGVSFFSDSICTSAAPSNMISVAPGASSAKGYIKGTTVQTGKSISGSSTGLTTGSQSIQFRKLVTSISPGSNHNCAVWAGVLQCWGKNSGALAIAPSTTTSFSTRQATLARSLSSVQSGNEFSCGLYSGDAYCWGKNTYGQLGLGTSGDNVDTTTTTTQVTGLPADAYISKLDVGDTHACAIYDTGTITGALACWGNNDKGQIGTGLPDALYGTAQTVIPSGVSSVATSLYHSCALGTDGTVKCWGYNVYGELGDGTTTSSNIPLTVNGLTGITALAVGRYHSCAVTSAGEVKCWGYGNYLGRGSSLSSSIPVSIPSLVSTGLIDAGDRHTCTSVAQGTVVGLKCWGSNTSGQNGNNRTASYETSPVSVLAADATTFTVPSIYSISAGGNSTCMIDGNGMPYCWGANSSGQLGLNSTSSTYTPRAVP